MAETMQHSMASFNEKPGPGQYNTLRSSFDSESLTNLAGSTASFSIPKQNTYRLRAGKLDPLKKDSLDTPGPGYYANHL